MLLDEVDEVDDDDESLLVSLDFSVVDVVDDEPFEDEPRLSFL